jgi:hypothetical protein
MLRWRGNNTVLPNRMCIDAIVRPLCGCSFFKSRKWWYVGISNNQGHYGALMAW